MTSSNNKPLIFIHINFSYHLIKNFLGKIRYYSKKTLAYDQFSRKYFIGSISNKTSLENTLERKKFAPLANTIQDYHKQNGPIWASKYQQKIFSKKMILDQNRKCLIKTIIVILINRHLLDDFIRRPNYSSLKLELEMSTNMTNGHDIQEYLIENHHELTRVD